MAHGGRRKRCGGSRRNWGRREESGGRCKGGDCSGECSRDRKNRSAGRPKGAEEEGRTTTAVEGSGRSRSG